MDIFSFLENIGTAIVEGIATFLYSPAFPYVFWTVLGLLALFILWKIYIAIRDRNLPNITYTREFTESGVYAGDEVELIETVCNRGFFPILGIDIEAYLYNELRLTEFEPPKKDGMQYFVSRFNLWPYMRIRRRHKLICLKRGHYKLQTAIIQKRVGEVVFDCPAEIYVYPRPLDIEPMIPPVSMSVGEERALRQLFADPFTVSGVRDYRFGDTVSQINFKVSARTYMTAGSSGSPLKVNDREFCAGRRFAIFIDYHLERDSGIDTPEYERRTDLALSYSAHLIRKAIYGGYSVGFFSNCKKPDGSMTQSYPIEGGEAHMIDIFKGMAEMRAADGGSFPALLDDMLASGENNTEMLMFILCPSGEIDARINELERRGNGVRVVLLGEFDREDEEHF